MMNAVVKPYHEMCLNSSELIVPRDTYQRALHPARVARIAKEFDERVANEPKISFRDGHYYVMDGQNTIAARKFLNGGEDLQIRCKVYFGMTEREEALLFAQQTGISERLSAGQKLRALIFAGEPAAVAFQQATELAGVHLSFEEGRGKQRISCIATAYHEFIRLGPDGDKHIRLAIGAAAVNGHAPAFVAQAVALGSKLRHGLCGKVCCGGRRCFAAGVGHRKAELGQGHPEQAEHDGEYAQPVEQAGAQFAHGETRSFPAEVCPKTGGHSQFSHGNAVLCPTDCVILQMIRPIRAEDWFLPAFCARAIIWYCVQFCAL